MKPTRSPFIAFLPAASLMALIFYLSSLPSLDLPETWFDKYLDKVLHTGAYGALTFFLLYGFLTSTRMSAKGAYILSAMMAVLYGFTDEFHQSFTPGRHTSIGDLIANATGAGLCILIYTQLTRFKAFCWLNLRPDTTPGETPS